MPPAPDIHALEAEERHARSRLARYKAKLYATPQLDSAAAQARLAEYDRIWRGAAARLRAARR